MFPRMIGSDHQECLLNTFSQAAIAIINPFTH
jgi:hypothetical protein